MLISFVLALALAFVPTDGRGQQAELFALLAFFLLAGSASAVSEARAQQRELD